MEVGGERKLIKSEKENQGVRQLLRKTSPNAYIRKFNDNSGGMYA